jgi:hypothetical protein
MTPLRLVNARDRGVLVPAVISIPAMHNEDELRRFVGSLSGVDAVGVESRVAKLGTRSLK